MAESNYCNRHGIAGPCSECREEREAYRRGIEARYDETLASLRGELDAAIGTNDQLRVRDIGWGLEVEELKAEIERLRNALKPFASVADDYDDREDSSFEVLTDMDGLAPRLLLLHFRDARSALSDK